MPNKPFRPGNFPWETGPGAIRPQAVVPQVYDLDQRLASITLASQQKVSAAASAKEKYLRLGGDKLITLPEAAVAPLRVAAADYEVDDISLLLGMVAALKELPEIATKVSQQIAGMGQQQTIEILNVQAKRTPTEILESIKRLDPTTISVETLKGRTMKDSVLSNADGKGLSAKTTVRITDIPVSDAMLSALRRGGLPGMEEWFIRPHQSREIRGDLPGLAIMPTDMSQKMLALLKAAGMTKVQIEQLVLSVLNKQLEGTEIAGTVTEVFFYDTKNRYLVDDKDMARNSPGAVDFTDLAKGLVILKEKEHASQVIEHLDSKLELSLGAALGVPGLDQIQCVFPLARRFSGRHREELAQGALEEAETRAQALLIQGGGQLLRVQTKLFCDFREGMRTEALRRTTPMAAEQELKPFLGDEARGILAVATEVDPETNTVQWRGEVSIYVQGDDLARNLVTRLQEGIRRKGRGTSPSDMLKSVRVDRKHPPAITAVRRKQAERLPAKASATVADLEETIAAETFRCDCTVVFPIRTKTGTALVWASHPSTGVEAGTHQTTMDELPDICSLDGYTDLRRILDDLGLEYNSAVLLQALMNLMANNTLTAEPSDDETYILLFSVRKYKSQAKRRRGGANQSDEAMVEDESDEDGDQHSVAKRGFGGSFHSTSGGGRGRGPRVSPGNA
jgi:hypothetical protein